LEGKKVELVKEVSDLIAKEEILKEKEEK